MDWSRRAGMAGLLALCLAGGLWAQAPAPPQQPQQPAPAQQPAPTQPETPPVNQEEETAYQAIFEIPRTSVQQLVEAGEAFAKKYPESRYLASVYTRLVSAYLALGDVDKLYAAGEKALELNPDNVDVLATVAYAVPRRLNTQSPGGVLRLQKVEQYSKHAVEVLNVMAKPEGLTDEDFNKAKNEKLSMAHSGLAMVSYHKQDFPGMAAELEQATQLAASPDPSDFYLLGIAYEQSRRFADASTAYGKCAEATWDYQDTCKQKKEMMQKQAGVQPK